MVLFKERLKELRKEKHLSQTELANELKVSQRCVSGWETGYREPDFKTLEEIAKYFEVTTDFLLGLTDY